MSKPVTANNLRVVSIGDLDVLGVNLKEISGLCNAISRLTRHPECEIDDDICCLSDIAVRMIGDLARDVVAMGVPVCGEMTA